MKLRNVLEFILVVLIVSGCATQSTNDSEANLPAPPAGLIWYEASNDVGTFLQPASWYVTEEANGNTQAVFISRENISEENRFIVGLSINEVSNWSKDNQSKPSEKASAYAQELQKSGKVLKSGVVKGNESDMHVVRVLGENKGVPTIVHHLIIGWDSRDQLYLISFESPETEWVKNYKLAKEMLNFFFLGG